MKEGDRVKLRPNAPLLSHSPALAGAVGVVGSLVRRNGDAVVHVRFAPPVNLLVLNAAASQFEPVDSLEPRLRLV